MSQRTAHTRLMARAFALTAIGVFLLGSAATMAAEPAPGEKPAPVLGGVRILPDKQGLQIEGRVARAEGILDFLAVVEGGREYESVLSLNCRPSALHAALLAMGAKPGPTPEYIKWLAENPDKKPANAPDKPGSALLIDVEWKDADGNMKKTSANSLLYNRRTKKAETVVNPWTFTGSVFYKDIEGKTAYGADVNGAVISVTPEDSVIQLGWQAGNPYDAEDQGFAVNTDAIPKAGTPVLVTLRLTPPPDKKD